MIYAVRRNTENGKSDQPHKQPINGIIISLGQRVGAA